MNKQFENLENLMWNPFVGDNYIEAPDDKKLLVVGESHYSDGEKESIEKHKNPEFTSTVIKEMAIERNYWGTRIFGNFHKTLFGNDTFDSAAFWNSTSFYNFIQRPMTTNKERPTKDDIHKGWLTFCEVIKILKPKTCLFIGVSASDKIDMVIRKEDSKKSNHTDFILKEFKLEEVGVRTKARSVIIENKESKEETKIIFIQHTSQFFSWRKWHNYLKEKLRPQLVYFSKG